MIYDTNIDIVNNNMYTKFGINRSIRFQDIEQKLNSFFFIQFNVPFKIISLIETSQSICGAKREYPGKTT